MTFSELFTLTTFNSVSSSSFFSAAA